MIRLVLFKLLMNCKNFPFDYLEALKCMLNLNAPPNSSDGPQWKVSLRNCSRLFYIIIDLDIRSTGKRYHLTVINSQGFTYAWCHITFVSDNTEYK